MNEELILFTVSILPVFLIGMFIYKRDKDKEPTKLLIKLFLGGFGSCLLTFLLSSITAFIFPILSADAEYLNLIELIFYVFVGIALVEEFSKWLMAYLISYKDEHFDRLYDAIIYCVFVALGFACFENLLYVYQNGLGTGFIRAVTAVPGHACDGLFMGYFLGLSKISELNNRVDLKNKNLLLSILVPTVTHGIYDYCLFTGKTVFIIIWVIFVIGTYVYFFKKIKKISAINRKMKYKDNYCSVCGHAINSDFCPVCGKKHD